MKSPIQQDTRLAAAAERRMSNWERLEEAAEHTVSRHAFDRSKAEALSYVAISRQAGAAGTTIGRLVAEHLGWKLYDINLLDEVANRYNEPRLMLDLVDETESNWVYDVLGTWMDRQIIPHEKFVVQLTRMIQNLARSGNAVFVGRGAQFVLPRSKTLGVRIVASEAFRAQRVMQCYKTTLPEALDRVRRTDRGRRDFVQRFFHHDINDPALYDLVINVERLGPAKAAEQITHSVCHATVV